jgi:hypothetical protein
VGTRLLLQPTSGDERALEAAASLLLPVCRLLKQKQLGLGRSRDKAEAVTSVRTGARMDDSRMRGTGP